MHSMNGEKTIMKDDREFDSWRTSGHQYPHSSGAMSSQSANSDPYGMSYYPTQAVFPYSDSMPSSQPWSNGAETMTFLGGYTPEHNAGQHSGHSAGHYAMEAMFGSQNTYGFGNAMTSPFNAFFPSNSDPFWGSNSKPSRQSGLAAPPGPAQYRMHDTDSYNYHPDSYGQINDQNLKQMESGLAGLTLDHIKASEQFAGKSMSGSGPFSAADAKKFDSIGSSSGAVGSVPKKMTWASIASQPAKPQPKSLKSKMSSSVLTGSTSKHLPPTSMEAIGTWESKNGSAVKTPPAAPTVPPPLQTQPRTAPNLPPQTSGQSWAPAPHRQMPQPPVRAPNFGHSSAAAVAPVVGESLVAPPLPAHPVLDKLRVENNYNPKEFDLNPRNARFFIIKSYSEDDIHRSIKYSIWCSTEHGNKRLDNAFKQQETKGPIYLLFSVNGSGHFCGMAQMMSYVDYQSSSSVWAQDKWKGQFKVKWIYVKDVPNAQLRHIRLENNENKPVTNSRDTQEVPQEKGKQVIKIMHHFRHTTSIFDDFLHYEKRQEEESQRRTDGPPGPPHNPPPPPPNGGHRTDKRAQQWRN